jgi:hypothetical protein
MDVGASPPLFVPWHVSMSEALQSWPPQVFMNSLQAAGPLSQSNSPPRQGQFPFVPPSQNLGPLQLPLAH